MILILENKIWKGRERGTERKISAVIKYISRSYMSSPDTKVNAWHLNLIDTNPFDGLQYLKQVKLSTLFAGEKNDYFDGNILLKYSK